MNERPVTIFLSAAEASGDEHAASLIGSLRRRLPEARFVGVAGAKMVAAGCEGLTDLTGRASMLGGPLLRLGYYVRTVRRLQKSIRDIRPDLHIPVDSPAMNWHLAAASRKIGTPVMYYIAPQVWAWAPWRVRKLARLTDHVACILPFEQEYLRHRGVDATYVGHPLFDSLPGRPDTLPDLLEAWMNGTWRVVLLPGSRPGEIRSHVPALLTVARAIRRRWPAAKCTLSAGSEKCAEIVRKTCGDDEAIELAVGRTHQVLAEAHFAIAVSGTVTLEVAHFGVPMVIFYRVGRLGYSILGPWLIRTPHLSLVNILAGRRIVPELMPWHGSRRQLVEMVLEVMEDLGYLLETRQSLIDIVEPLRAPPPRSASDNAAALAVSLLERNRRSTVQSRPRRRKSEGRGGNPPGYRDGFL